MQGKSAFPTNKNAWLVKYIIALSDKHFTEIGSDSDFLSSSLELIEIVASESASGAVLNAHSFNCRRWPLALGLWLKTKTNDKTNRKSNPERAANPQCAGEVKAKERESITLLRAALANLIASAKHTASAACTLILHAANVSKFSKNKYRDCLPLGVQPRNLVIAVIG